MKRSSATANKPSGSIKQIDTLNGKQILFIKQSSLGDIVHALPVAHTLKRCFPDCTIGWVVQQGLASMLERDQTITRIHPIHIPSTSEPGSPWSAYYKALLATFQTLKHLRQDFRAQPYDWIFDLHGSFRSGLFSRMNPGGTRLGLGDAKELNTLFQDRLIKVNSASLHAVDENLLFCSAVGCVPGKEDFYLDTSAADEHEADALLRAYSIRDDECFVYVNPAARWQSKFWLAPRWSALCERLESSGLRVVFGGSSDDLKHIEPIVVDMIHKACIAAGRLSLMASVALLKKAAVYLGVDTGPMHIAAMVGTPVVALFGPTHPERVGPYGIHHAVIQADNLDCLCCRKRLCNHQRCMQGITVERVYAQVLNLV